MVADEIALPISIVFNELLATGVLPGEFKIGHLHPAPKARKIQLKRRSELSRNHVGVHPFEGSGERRAPSDIKTFRIIPAGPYPLLSLDFVEAIHALICCWQLLMTGSLRETQSYAQRSSSLT